MKNTFFYLLVFVMALIGCAKEPIFEMPPALKLVSWADRKDTNWNATASINGKTVNLHAVANYLVTGFDTQTVIRLNFGNNDLNLEQVVFGFRNNQRKLQNKYSKNSLVNVYFESKTAVYSASSVKLDSAEFQIISGTDFKNFDLSQLFFKGTTISTTSPNISFTISTIANIPVKQSYFEAYQKGKVLELERDYWKADLKGGSEFAPSPTLDFVYDWKSPNDIIILRVGTEQLTNTSPVAVDKNTLLKKKGVFYKADQGTLSVQSFYYKGSLQLKGENWNFTDTTTQTSILKIDSVNLRFYYMPF
jgi:hypothetical protein